MTDRGGGASGDTLLGVDRQVVVLGVARMADAVANSFLIIVLPLYIASDEIGSAGFGATESLMTGLILAMFGIVNTVAQPVAGRFSDRLGRRKAFVVWGLVVVTVANLAYALAGGYASLLLVRACQGIAAGATIVASIALVNELSLRGRRGGNMGIFNSFRLVGFGLGPLAAGAIVDAGPYRLPVGDAVLSGYDAAFVLAAAAAFASVVFVQLFVHDPERTTPSPARKLALAVRSAEPGRLLDPIFTLGLATLVMAASISVLAPIEPHVNARLDQGPTLFGVQFAVFIISLALVQPFVGRASDRRGRRPFIFTGLVLLAPATLVQGLVTTSEGLILARLGQGLSAALVFAPALALAGDLAERGQSGVQLSMLTVAFGLGLSVGQLSSGYLVRFGYVTPFLFGTLLAAAGAALVGSQLGIRPTAAAAD